MSETSVRSFLPYGIVGFVGWNTPFGLFQCTHTWRAVMSAPGTHPQPSASVVWRFRFASTSEK